MRILMQSLLIVLIASFATLILAEDPQPQTPTDPATDRTTAPDIAVNKDEIAAGVEPDAVDDKALQPNPSTEKPMIAEIRATLDASRTAVSALMAQTPADRDHTAELDLQRQVAELKQQAELDILAIQARYARQDGNEELTLKIEAAIATILSPPTPEAPATTRPAPDNQH